MQLLLFFIFAAICVAGAVNLLAQRHPINSALSLIVVMGSLAVIYLLLGAEFVAAIQLIVYAGAIMVLFVFVIMLLNAGEEERTPGSRVASLFGYPAVAILAGLLTWVFLHGGRQVAGAIPLGGALAAPAGYWPAPPTPAPPPTSAACSSAISCCPSKSRRCWC